MTTRLEGVLDLDKILLLFIKQYESEPYHQHLNIAEQFYGLSRGTSIPTHCWLLFLVYVCALLNLSASPALDRITPLQALAGQVWDLTNVICLGLYDHSEALNLKVDTCRDVYHQQDEQQIYI